MQERKTKKGGVIKMTRVIICLALVCVFSFCLAPAAQADELSELKAQMKAMQEQMEAMQKRIEELEKEDKSKLTKIDELRQDLEVTKAQAAAGPLEGYELGEGFAPLGEEGLRLSGFSALSFENSENVDSTFKLSHFNLYVDIPVGEDFKAFGEIEFEDGGSSAEGTVKMERAWLDWYLEDWAKLKFGLMINPFDRWNLIHADPLVPTTTKPLIVNQGRMMEHVLGAKLFGSVFPGDWEIDYHLGFANGKGPTPKSQDVNEDKMIFGRVNFIPPLGDKGDLEFGFSAMTGEDGNLSDADENMVGADLVYYYGPFGIWAEWYKSWIDPTTEANFEADGFFIMGMYEFIDKWTAIVRYEQNDPKSTAKTSNFTDGSRWLWGINYKPIPPVVFKLEYILHEEEGDNIGNNAIVSSVNVLF